MMPRRKKLGSRNTEHGTRNTEHNYDRAMKHAIALIILLSTTVYGQERDMARINWMEFRELVPSKIRTVLLPTGTLEPHGVANNGADITAPEAMARDLAPRLNAMTAPAVPYGITGSMEAYPGALQIPEAAYRPYIKAVLDGLAKNGFRSIIILNGHGGPQTAVLTAVAAEVATEKHVRTL